MEVKNENGKSNSGGCRWNPTKEQINMLEGFYRDGMRTPSTEQIQEMTKRLKAYGHIEGKNVFYWFQNHKARERQRQQRHQFEIINNNMSCHYNRFHQFHLHDNNQLASSSTVPSVFAPLIPFPPSSTNGVVSSSPFYTAQNSTGGYYYPHHYSNKLPLPRSSTTSSSTNRIRSTVSVVNDEKTKMMMMDEYKDVYSGASAAVEQNHSTRMGIIDTIDHHETLPLFPLHPTHGSNDRGSHSSMCSSSSSESRVDDDDVSAAGNINNQPFFDFFANRQG